MKRFWRLSALAACLLAALVFGGCLIPGISETPGGGGDSGGGDEPIDAAKNITLNIQSAAPLKYNYKALLLDSDEDSQIYKQAAFTRDLVEGFKEKYPNIKLNFIEDGWGDALHQKTSLYIRDWLAGGKMPMDILIGETYMGYYAKNGVFEELEQTKFSDVVEGSYADMVVEGKIYGVPAWTGILGLQYNTDILREAGVPEGEWAPATWAQLLQNVQAVNAYAASNSKAYSGIIVNGVAGLSGAFRALPFMRQAGGDFLDADGNVAVDGAANVRAFQYLRQLAQYTPANSLNETSEDALQSMFIVNKKAAYMVEGQWSMITASTEFKSAPLPKENADDARVGNAYIGSGLFGVTKGSQNKAAAKAFLEYLTSAEVQLNLYKKDGRLPVSRAALTGGEAEQVNPNMNTYIDMLLTGGFAGGLPCFERNGTTIWENWGTFYKNVLTSNQDIQALATGLKNTVNDLLA